jgi:hypothetical protein
MAAAFAAIAIYLYLNTASEPHLLSNISIGNAVTDDIILSPTNSQQ